MDSIDYYDDFDNNNSLDRLNMQGQYWRHDEKILRLNILAAASARRGPHFGKILSAISRGLRSLAGGPVSPRYRPEKHYMRGPGPKSKPRLQPK